MSEILLESLRGVRIFRRGVREKGGSDEPRTTPPGYGPASCRSGALSGFRNRLFPSNNDGGCGESSYFITSSRQRSPDCGTTENIF